MFKSFLCGLGLLMIANTAVADETVFKINNSLAKIDLAEMSESYILVFDQLVDDLKNGGISFSHNGTAVSPFNNSQSYFTVKDVKILIKKEILEKYAQHTSLAEKRVFFERALDNYGYEYIFNNDEERSKYENPKLILKLDVLDKNGIVLASQQLKTELPGYTNVSMRGFFKHLARIPATEYKNMQIERTFAASSDYEFKLSLEDIQKIDSLRFSVLDYK